VKRISLLFVIISFGIQPISSAQSNSKKLEEYIESTIVKYDLPGVALVVINNDSIIIEGAYGFSNLSTKAKTTTNTVYPIASMDKQLIGTCIMILYEQGLLSLDDRITKFLVDAPEAWSDIKVKNLLSHTSGIPNKMPKVTNLPISDDALYAFIKKQKLAFEPGNGWLYSDAGFVILQLIVKHLSGQPFDQFQSEHILLPLEMTNTRILTPGQMEGRAMYYDKSKGKVKENKFRLKDRGPLYNDLGSSISDFAKWDIAISKNKILQQSTYDMMWSPFILNNGKPVSNLDNANELFEADRSYGYSWLIKSFNNHRIIYHSGYTGTSITRFPDDSLSVILFSNLVDPLGFNPNIIARHIAELYLPGSSPYMTEAKKDPTPDITDSIKRFIQAIENGLLNKNVLTVEFTERMLPALSKFQKVLNKGFGEMMTLEYKNEYRKNENRTIIYKATYNKGVLYYQVELDSLGKICFMTVER
jgi:CubicO group peptidase (beta-lactamase class C family)